MITAAIMTIRVTRSPRPRRSSSLRCGLAATSGARLRSPGRSRRPRYSNSSKGALVGVNATLEFTRIGARSPGLLEARATVAVRATSRATATVAVDGHRRGSLMIIVGPPTPATSRYQRRTSVNAPASRRSGRPAVLIRGRL